ncbi:MAG: hypothetical protein ACYTF1_00260 [Planctomycetota bacterium]|jgi:uncharacterized protein YfcZ (UPF0381/DUF406 family)
MGILDAGKAALETVKQVHDAKLQIELTQQIIVLQQTAMNLQEDSQKLKDRIKELEDTTKLKEQFYFEGNAYYRKDDESKHPYCMACMDLETNPIRLYNCKGGFGMCTACRNEYRDVFK